MRRLVDALLGLMGLLATVQFIAIAWIHLRSPAELDYIEGPIMDQIVRVARGQPLYVAPSLSFVPLAYMPGFTFLAALPARLFGPAYWEPRLISVIATLGIAALCFVATRAESRRWALAAAAAGLYLIGYRFAGGGHYDVARPDSLMVFLALAGIATLRFTTGRGGAIASAMLMTAAFFTKQHGLLFAAGAMGHLALNDRRRVLPFALTLVLGCGGGFLVLTRVLGPWFAFYTWDVPSHWSQLNLGRIQAYVRNGLFGLIGPMTVGSLLSLALPERAWRGRAGVWAWTCAAGIATGMMASLDPNAWKHLFIPTMACCSLFGPIALHRLAERLVGEQQERATRVSVVCAAVLVLQYGALQFAPRLELPARDAPAAHAELIRRLRALPGPVILLHHGFFTWQADKGISIQDIGFGDIQRARGNALLRRDPGALERVLDPLRAGPGRPLIITDMPLSEAGPIWTELGGTYKLRADWGLTFAALAPPWGYAGVPRYVYEPREAAPGGGRP